MEPLDLVTSDLYRHKKINIPVREEYRPADLDALQNFETRPSDVFLVSYPKSGTTWMLQVLVQVLDAAHPECAEDITNRFRVTWLEDITINKPARELSDPRFYGSHLPPDMLPRGVEAQQSKVVYVWRNPKDVLVSFYHFTHSYVMLDPAHSFDEFLQRFLDGDVFMGSWFDHVREYLELQHRLNIHFVKYEDMLKDLRAEVVKVCSFLGEDLPDEVIDGIVENSTFKTMKKNPKANYKELIDTDRYKTETMRKGLAGDWKNVFTVAQNERFDKVFEEKMKNFPQTCTWEVHQ